MYTVACARGMRATGADDQAAGNEADVLTGVEHVGQPVEGGVRVAAAHGFDEGGDGVVVPITHAVVAHGFFLDGFLRHLERDAHGAILPARGGESRYLERGESFAHVTIRLEREVGKGIVLHLQGHEAEPALGLRNGTAEQGDDIRIRHGLQRENLGA